jgi:hypothetical protein
MTDDIVSVGEFGNSLDAEMARDLLQEQDIPAYVSGDASGAFGATLDVVQGVRLMVRASDAARARDILEEDNKAS